MSARITIALLLYAQSAVAQNDPITRVTVNEVRIDAVVTDSKGNIVPNLPGDTFEVFQDGKRQKGVHVQFVAGPERAARTRRPGELKVGDVTRTIVVVIDDADMSFASFFHARQAVKQCLDRAMQPGDLVAVVRTMQDSSYLNPFMSDPAAVRMSIDQIHYYPRLSTRGSFQSVIPLLHSVLSALTRMPGRKSLMLFSGSMRIPANSPVDPFLMYRQLADAALRASVKIYGIDARGLTTQKVFRSAVDGVDEAVRILPGSSPAEQQLRVAMNDSLSPVDANFPPRPSDPRLGGGAFPQTSRPPGTNDMDGLAFLANETGGLMMADNNDLGAELQKAVDHQSGYYLIAWDPGEKAFVPTKGTFADFHTIRVKLTRAGLTARAPRSFYGAANGAQNPDRSPRIAMQEALLAPFQSGQFDARMNSAFEVEGGRGYIRSFVYIDGKDIAFAPEPDNQRNDCYSIHLEFLTLPQPIDGRVETLAESQVSSLKMCGTSYEEIARQGLAVTMLHPVEKSGGYQMRMAVRNVRAGDTSSLARTNLLLAREEGDRPVGSAHQLVEVPEWRTTPSVFGIEVQSEKLTASVVRPRMAGETDRNMTLSYRPAVAGDPSLRRFRPGEKLRCQAHVVNVTDPAAEIRVVRTDTGAGAPVYAEQTVAILEGAVSGSFTIESSLAPGSYDLQMIVTGKTVGGQPYQGVAGIDFELLK